MCTYSIVKEIPASGAISVAARHAAKLQEHLQRKLDERKIRQRKSGGSTKQGALKFKQPNARTIPIVPAVSFAHKTANGVNATASSATKNALGEFFSNDLNVHIVNLFIFLVLQ